MMKVCRREELRAGTVVVTPLSDDLDGPREGLVLVDESGALRGYVNRCQHLPVPIDGGSREFFGDDEAHLVCRTHGATYRLRDGLCVAGPCRGRSLEPLPIVVDQDGWVRIDPDP